MNTLTYPRHLLRRHLRELLQGGRRFLSVPLGRSWCRDGGLDYLVARAPTPAEWSLRMTLQGSAFTGPDEMADRDHGGEVVLQIGAGPLAGQARGWFRCGDSGGWCGLERMDLSGAGMDRVYLTGKGGAATAADLLGTPDEIESRSRTIGAQGIEAFRRLTNLRHGFVGLGRLNGNFLFRLVETSGLRSCVLVDPDTVELHNTGESLLFDESSLGGPKVHAAEDWLALHHPGVEVAAIARSVTHGEAIDALKACDILISAPDHPGARLAAGAIAAAYCRPLIDIGTLVARDGGLGADVRLILPDRCLLCFGGVSDESRGRLSLASPDREETERHSRDWRAERAGSLDSLNDLAACAGRRLLERCVGGRQRESVWLQFDETEETPLRVTLPQPPPERECFCAISGWGDAGIPRVLELLEGRLR